MYINRDEDRRISSALSLEPRRIVLRNLSTGLDEEFELDGEQGRGGSCIVYRAFVIENGARQRPVLLKEFYPIEFADDIRRDLSTGALHYDGFARKAFNRSRENFLKVCQRQAAIYLRHAVRQAAGYRQKRYAPRRWSAR